MAWSTIRSLSPQSRQEQMQRIHEVSSVALDVVGRGISHWGRWRVVIPGEKGTNGKGLGLVEKVNRAILEILSLRWF